MLIKKLQVIDIDLVIIIDGEVQVLSSHRINNPKNTNRLLRQYFPKGTDLSVHSQTALNKVARQLNERPRETLGFETTTSGASTSNCTAPQ